MGHPSKKLSIRATAPFLFVLAIVAVLALPPHQTRGYGADSEGGWTVENRFTHERLDSDSDDDAGTGHHPQELPPSTSAGETPDEADWTVVGLAVVIAVASALVLARRAR
jgi:hypothetical protein